MAQHTDLPASPSANPPEAPATPPAARPRRRWLWVMAVLFAGLLSALGWLTGSESGFAWLWTQMPALTGKALSARAEGTLWSGFTLHELRWRSADTDLDIDRAHLDWQPSALWHGRLHLALLDVGNVKMSSRPGPSKPSTGAPKSLELPLNVQVDQLKLASLTLLPSDLRFYGLDLAYRYETGRHQLEHARLQTPWGNAQASLDLAGKAPFDIHGELKANGELEQVAVRAAVRLGGNLSLLDINGEADGKGILAEAHGQLRPFAINPYNRFTRLDLRVGGVNPHALMPGWPQARLGFAVHAEPQAGQGVKGGVSLINNEPGLISDGKLPIALAVGEFSADDKRLHLDRLMTRLIDGQIDITGKAEPGSLDLAALLEGVRLRSLHAAAPDDTIKGTLRVSGPAAGPDIKATLYGRTLQLLTQLGFAQDKAGKTLLLRQLDFSAGAGSLSLTGKLGLAGKQEFEVNGKLSKADPSRVSPSLPVGDLNATLKASGQLAKPLSGKLALQFAPSRLSGAPLTGQATLDLQEQRLRQLQADLRLADNRLQANGAYGAPGDKLKLTLDAPNLALLGKEFSGLIKGDVELAGTPKAPLISARLQASRLRLPGNLAVQSLNLDGNVQADAASPFRLQLAVDALQAGGFVADQLRAQASGTRARHQLQLDGRIHLADHPYGVQLLASGGLPANGGQWQGMLQKLELTGKPGLSLLSPVALEAGPERVKLGSTRLALLGGSLSLNEFVRQANGSLSSRGRADGIRLAELAPLVSLPLEHNLVFDANWDLNLNGAHPQGSLLINRSAGDINIPGDSGRTSPLGLRQARVNLRFDGGQVLFDTLVDSRYARLDGKGSLPWNNGVIDGRTPLSASAALSVPSLGDIAKLASPSLELGGQLSANLALSGPIAQPQGSGLIVGRDLMLADHKTGIRLAEGVLQARLAGRSLILERLRFAGGKGEVTATGALDLQADNPNVNVKVNLDKFSVFDKPNRKLVVSGGAELAVLDKKISLTGRIRADQGRVDLPKFGAPSLGDDVVVKGRQPPEPSAFSSLPLTVALDLDLGDRFRFAGQGLDVDLTGVVKVSANPGLPPAARGQVRVVRGRYKAYGQDLDIETGIITFVGPLDNPLLNVVAKRHLSPVGAGVEVSGSASAPRIRLVADESMSEKDKLAWLVLGHAASSDRDDNALAAAAGLMLAGSINDQVGFFDDLGLTSRKEKTLADGSVSPAEQVVTVGRQLTRELYLGYEYGVTSADQAVKLAYQLTRNWSMVVRAGTNTSVESRYTLRFD